MEEYNLNQDNANYQQALSAYQNDLVSEGNEQAEKDREHDEAHEAWSVPVNVIGGDLVAKPIKTFLKSKAKSLITKGVKKGEQVVADRAEQIGKKVKNLVGDKLFEGGNRPFQGTSSSLDEAYNGVEPLTGTAESLRGAVARLRQLSGGRPLGSGGEEVNLQDLRTPQGGAEAPTPWDNPQPSSSALEDLRGEATVVNPGDSSETAELSSDQQDAVNSILNGESPERALFKYRMRTMDTPTASQARANLAPDQPTNASSQADRFQSRLNDIDRNQSTGDAGEVSEGNTNANSGNTADNLSGEADETGKVASDAVEDTAKVASKVATPVVEGIEGAEAGVDAAAAAEGGLNPVADLVALGLGIASLFGANAPDPDGKVAYSPLNPTIQHGI
jgi:hypothetical protein